ncbi:MAG: hypothetical protein ACREUT_12265 [Steroidobacteraceae bacterium]
MDPKSYLSAEQLYALGRTATLQSVPEQSRESLPIPVRGPGGLTVAFFFCPSLAIPRAGVKMAPPHYLVTLDPSTGRVRELRAVVPAEFGRRDAPDAPLGLFNLPAGMTPAQYLEQRGTLFVLYDRLLPAFAHPHEPVSALTRAAAKQFGELFAVLEEPPVAPYYNAVGRDFFDWLQEAAGDVR